LETPAAAVLCVIWIGFVAVAAIAAGALAVWRRSYRPVTLTAALLGVFPPVAVLLIAEITRQSM
jgi:hypothetical protein